MTRRLNDEDELDKVPQPIRGNEGYVDKGPRNVMLDRQNPDILSPPATDHGTLPNMKFSFSMAHQRLQEGGWTRQVTQRELPVATTIAGVDMCLKPGGIRELHWHKEAEWAYLLWGTARISGVDQNGQNFLDDVGPGDMWNFPSGIPHSIHGLQGGCEFLLLFDDGRFSEDSTFLITDWFNCTPKEVLARNFGVSESDFADLPINVDHTRYIFQGEVPGPLSSDKVKNHLGERKFSYRISDLKPVKTSGGTVRIIDSTIFPAASTIAVGIVEVEPGGMRELHWHPNTDEWQYHLEGTARMTVFAAEHNARTFDYGPGDVGAVPFAYGHYVENTSDDTLRFLEVFKSPQFQDVSLNQWMALTPPELVKQHLEVNDNFMRALRKEKRPIVK
ncbi:bicupin, oxalate decarboxylase family [Candidatus Nitrososphaera evergladensis SR1]|uniref:Bicupin, oxalate decarboxylase family n=1 Tax=Candidatus Nitrososphaera evergladensis SR1 TaxID=1459636 RepID=A0A075MQ85_9ARCH|nr:oxalate decarboxylase family bicupin [Candidatus Nitrososphaera evergladensis]AIF83230.1 bicupin, oxalate decarboxylase family [Candidatus Nitrososphaera evergladensis SR1]